MSKVKYVYALLKESVRVRGGWGKETTKMSGKSVQRCGSNINVEMQMNNNS